MVVGLGNPGERYEGTRHNVGFSVLDSLASSLDVRIGREECRSLIGRTRIGDSVVELVKPMTFMNLSGEAVACLLAKGERTLANTIVVYDDIALPLGVLRIRPKGTHGGHNGMRSIISQTESEAFTRVRVGIMPDHPINDVSDFVLGRFASSEHVALKEATTRAVEAVEVIIRFGIEKAMHEFN
jgi:PTH1 family peptidyl-tRNA hydrolase